MPHPVSETESVKTPFPSSVFFWNDATFNHVPCITLNSYTEHQETVKQGTNVLVGEDADRLASELHRLLQGEWTTGQLPDRWDGRTAERIVSMLCASTQ